MARRLTSRELPGDFAARVRAADAYAARRRQDFADATGIPYKTLQSYEEGTLPQPNSVPTVVARLAAASKLPEWFFTAQSISAVGAGTGSDVGRQVAALKESIDALAEQITASDPAQAAQEAASRAVKLMTRQIDERLKAIARAQTPPQSRRAAG